MEQSLADLGCGQLDVCLLHCKSGRGLECSSGLKVCGPRQCPQPMQHIEQQQQGMLPGLEAISAIVPLPSLAGPDAWKPGTQEPDDGVTLRQTW